MTELDWNLDTAEDSSLQDYQVDKQKREDFYSSKGFPTFHITYLLHRGTQVTFEFLYVKKPHTNPDHQCFSLRTATATIKSY
jgi:hypothetical protein